MLEGYESGGYSSRGRRLTGIGSFVSVSTRRRPPLITDANKKNSASTPRTPTYLSLGHRSP